MKKVVNFVASIFWFLCSMTIAFSIMGYFTHSVNSSVQNNE
jgi:hypothetical protein